MRCDIQTKALASSAAAVAKYQWIQGTKQLRA
jgi:hypothetical protein